MTKTRRIKRSSGFTLIEMVAVITIVAILAGAASLSLRSPYQIAQFEDAKERLVMVDQQIREHARHCGRAEQLTITPNSGRIAARAPDKQTAPMAAFRLDSRVIEQVAIAGRRSDCDEVAIDYTAQGRSATYAVRLRGPSGKSHWLLFAGATGQMIQIGDETTIEELLKRVSAKGTDAD
jgi:type II secretion system protein H